MSSYLKLDTSLETSLSVANASFPSEAATSASIAVWCRLSSKSISVTLFQRYDGSNGYEAKFNEEVNGDLSLEFIVNGSSKVTSRIENVPVKIGEWQLFVFQIELTGNQGIYVDSVLHSDTQSAGSSPLFISTEDFYIGIDNLNPSSSSYGSLSIDGFAFYNGYLLDDDEIRNIYNRGRGSKMSSSTPNLDFGFNFDEGAGSVLTDVVSESEVGTIISNASPFDNVWGETGGVAVMLPSDIKMYLTSLEPDMAQTNYTQSIGGYISTSLLYPYTTLASSLGLYGTSITLDDATDLIGYSYVSILNEIIQVEDISSINVTATERGVNETIGYYPSGTIVQGVSSPFSDSFNTDKEQYRCYAIKNTSDEESAYDLSAYFEQLSRNLNTTMRLALEVPKSQEITGVSTSWTSSMLIDISLAGTYEDNWFADSYMRITSGPNSGSKRIVNSYDGTTGTFVFIDSLTTDFDPLIHSPSASYTVDASPAQRVKSGVDAPVDTDFITDFSEASDRSDAVELSTIKSEGILLPGEIIYIWIEREIKKSSTSYNENSFVLSLDFEKELEGN